MKNQVSGHVDHFSIQVITKCLTTNNMKFTKICVKNANYNKDTDNRIIDIIRYRLFFIEMCLKERDPSGNLWSNLFWQFVPE